MYHVNNPHHKINNSTSGHSLLGWLLFCSSCTANALFLNIAKLKPYPTRIFPPFYSFYYILKIKTELAPGSGLSFPVFLVIDYSGN